MNRKNETFDTVLGNRVTACGDLEAGEGGQGIAKLAQWSGRPGEQFVLKVFGSDLDPKATRERTDFLIRKSLDKRSPLFCTPVDRISDHSVVGHVAPFADGLPLNDFLQKAPRSLMQTHCAAIAIAQGLDLLDKEGMSYGDIKPGNVLLGEHGSAILVFFIDLDNFGAKGVAPPPSYGDPHYAAPEIVRRMKEGRPGVPDKYADRFSLGVLLHVLLLFVHPSEGNDMSEDRYSKAMWEGKWLLDPYAGSLPPYRAGRPPAVLNASLAEAIRGGMSLERADRTSAEKWLKTLLRTSHEITLCPDCGRAMYFDPTRRICPYDNRLFSSLSVVLPNGVRIPVESNHVVLGRDLLKSPHVSAPHVVLRKLGNETSLETMGRYGTWKLVKGVWEPLKPGVQTEIAAGMKFKLADVEIGVEK